MDNNLKNNDEKITAPVLDDIDYVEKTSKKGDPTGVSAPVLDDLNDVSFVGSSKKGEPVGVSTLVCDNMSSNKLSDEEIIRGFSAEQLKQFENLTEEKKKMVIDFRRKQLEEVKAPILDEPDYIPPSNEKKHTYEEEIKAPVLDEPDYIPPSNEKKHTYEEELKAPVLDEVPETPEYVPKYTDDSLEKIKREAAKKSVESQLVSNQKDEKESLRMMQQLREERERRDASTGFKLTIILAITGIISAVLFIIFASGEYFGLSYKPDMGSKAAGIVSSYSLYIGIAVSICSFLLITGIKFFKSLATLVFMLFTALVLFAGIIMLTQKDGNMPVNIIIYAISLIGSGYTFFSLTSNDKIHLFFTKK